METIVLLEEKELDYLNKNFHLTTSAAQDEIHSIKSIDLLEEEKCESYLDWLSNILHSPSRMITASQFSKRYAFSAVSASLYAMAMYNKGLNLTNCHVESKYDGSLWQANLRINNICVTQPNTKKTRNDWRDEMIKHIFADHLWGIWHSLSTVANIPMSILWENTAIRIFSLYEKRLGEEASRQEKAKIQDDFDYLVNKAPGNLFGERNNPLTKFYGPVQVNPLLEQPIRIRKTCCYYYKVSADKNYCSACPKVKY